MKKLLLLTFLILFSCNKVQENTKIENTTGSISGDNQVITQKITNENNRTQEENAEELKNVKNLSSTLLTSYKTLPISLQVSLECEGVYGIRDNRSQKEIDEINNFTKSCNELKQKAQKELDKKITDFKITDCKKLEKNQEGNTSQNTGLVETCEFKIALDKGCEILKDETKVKKCSDYKDLKEKIDVIKSFDEFDLVNYL